MMRLIMGNRWFALLWVVMVAFSVAKFAGKDGEGIKAFDQAAERVRARKAAEAKAQSPQAADHAPAEEAIPIEREPIPGDDFDPAQPGDRNLQ